MIKAVIFDVGGVLVRTYAPGDRRKWEARLGLEPGSLAGLVFDSELGRKAQLGRISADEVWSWLANYLHLNSDELATLRHDFWAGDWVDQPLCDYIRMLRRHYRIGMLSNAWAPDGQAMAEIFGFADCFDAFVTSAEVGVMKPDARIYHVMLERLEVRPPEAVFVDDFVENVAAARRLGMQAIHFTDPASVRSELQALLGL